MGVGDIIGLAVCWVCVAAVLTWGILTEGRRGRDGELPGPERRGVDLRTTRYPSADWVLVECLPGWGPAVRRQGDLVVDATLAARGIDPGALRPGDRRVEVAGGDDGATVMRFFLRRSLLSPAQS